MYIIISSFPHFLSNITKYTNIDIYLILKHITLEVEYNRNVGTVYFKIRHHILYNRCLISTKLLGFILYFFYIIYF